MNRNRSERALIVARIGRDSVVAAGVLGEAGISSTPCAGMDALLAELENGAGFVLVTEEALLGTDLRGLDEWIKAQPEWSDLPFVLLTHRGGGLERNPDAARALMEQHLDRGLALMRDAVVAGAFSNVGVV